MSTLTVGDIRPFFNIALASPLFSNAGTLAAQLRSILEAFPVPITAETSAALDVIEANPILVQIGFDELRSALDGLPDSTLLSDVPQFASIGGDGSTGGGGSTGDDGSTGGSSTTTDAFGNKVDTFTLPFSGATIQVSGETVTVTPQGGPPQTLTGLDRLEFTDGTLFLDVNDGAGALAEAYTSLLGRGPDAAGFDFWLNALEAKTVDLQQVMEAFVATDDFQQKYAAELNDTGALLDQFYLNIFNRTADEAGKVFWTNAIEDNGGLDFLDETLALMLQSDEFATLIGVQFSDGIFV